MVNIGERIKKVRKKEGLTQAQFAERIGSSQNTVARYEMGQRMPSASVMALICKEFHVRPDWLRDGIEPMEAPSMEDQSLEALLGQSEITDRDRSLVKVFLRLDATARAEVIRFVEECARELSSPAADQPSSADAASRLADLERQLAAEKARADRAEAEARAARDEAKARTDELLEVYREEDAVAAAKQEEFPVGRSEGGSSRFR